MELIVILGKALKGVFLLLVVTLGVCWIYSIRYQQIGSTCGFYSLVYGVSKVKRINKKQIVKRIIQDYINNGKSCVGEIFNIALMEEIAEKYFPYVKAKVVEIGSMEDIDKILEDNYIVYTCLYETTPHYYFLENSKNGKYVYRSGLYKRMKMKKEKFFQIHVELKQVPEYKWEWYYAKNSSVIEKILSPIASCCMFFSDSELFLFLKKNKKQKQDVLLKQETISVDMYGKILIIPRTKIPAK